MFAVNDMLKRPTYSIWLRIVIFVGLTLLSLPSSPLAAEAGLKETGGVRSWRVVDYLRDKLKSEPNIDPKDLAALGNLLIEQKGFDYDFDVCDLIDRNPDKIDSVLSPREETWDYPMTFAGGKSINLKIITDRPSGGGGGCDECFFSIPVLNLTTSELLI